MFRARAVSTTNVNDGYHPSASTWLTFVDVVRILRRFRHNKARRCCNLPARTETNRSPMATDVTRRDVARAVCVSAQRKSTVVNAAVVPELNVKNTLTVAVCSKNGNEAR